MKRNLPKRGEFNADIWKTNEGQSVGKTLKIAF